MFVRRVVTGRGGAEDGRVVSDGPAPRTHDFVAMPGMAQTLVWATDPGGAPAGDDPTPAVESFVPAPGGTRFIVLHIPPEGDVDPEAAGPEHLRASPGLAELFEPDGSGFHRTPTVDYVVVLSGELTLDLGDGGSLTLGPGDTVVQGGARHAWRNRSRETTVAAFVLVGAPSPEAAGAGETQAQPAGTPA